MKKVDTYTNSYTVNYVEGDTSLQRQKILHQDDLEDKSYIIKEEDTLTSIAFKFYDDPLKWYIIADVNDIDNPFILEIGLSIVIPNINNYNV